MQCKDCGSGNAATVAFCECGAPLFTPAEAAEHYTKLAARDQVRFAHDYEDKSAPEAYDEYLDVLDVLACSRGEF